VSVQLAARSRFESFAGPFDFGDDGLFEVVVVEHARGVVEALLAACGHLPRNAAPARYLAGWLDGVLDAETCWHPAFPRAARRIGAAGEDARHLALAEIALRAAERTTPGSCTFASPAAPVRFANTVLPCAERVTFESSGTSVRFELASGGRAERFRFDLGAQRWVLAAGDERRVVTLPVVPFGTRRVTLADRAKALSVNATTTVPLSTVGAEKLGARCGDALTLVSRYAPAFTSWIERVLRVIVPRSTGDGTLFSGSASDAPGIVELSFDTRLVSIAEALVHESTHQYLHVATRVARVDDGSDPTLYYSPVKRTGRPVRAILVAYHAFANVVLFYKLCRAGGIDDEGYCARNEAETRAQLAVLEQALRATRALTDVGEALWRPLARRLAEA